MKAAPNKPMPAILVTTIGLRSSPIKGDFVTEIPPFCDIIHICCRSARQHVDSLADCPLFVTELTPRRTSGPSLQ